METIKVSKDDKKFDVHKWYFFKELISAQGMDDNIIFDGHFSFWLLKVKKVIFSTQSNMPLSMLSL